MILLRKMDYSGQLVLGVMMLLSVPILFFYGVLAGLFIMGIWQLISALLNTNIFLNSIYKKKILRYWLYCFMDFGLLGLGYIWGTLISEDDAPVIFCIAILGAIGVAIYYLVIYRKLIGFLSIRDELDGLTKSKH
jgi:high-affinity Fe2+/Pb2+ permease